jgi:hypothetical protein
MMQGVDHMCENICINSIVRQLFPLGVAIWIRVPDPTGTDIRTIFYPWVTLVPDPNRDRYETNIFFHTQVN